MPVKAVEGTQRQGTVELGSVAGELSLEVVEHTLRQAARLGVGPHHEGRHRTDRYRFRQAAITVSGDVVHDFAAGGVSNVDGVLEIGMGSQRR